MNTKPAFSFFTNLLGAKVVVEGIEESGSGTLASVHEDSTHLTLMFTTGQALKLEPELEVETEFPHRMVNTARDTRAGKVTILS